MNHAALLRIVLVIALQLFWGPSRAIGTPEGGAPVQAPAPVAVAGGLLKSAVSQQQVLTFCVADWNPIPITLCSNETATKPEDFTGHDVEMIRDAAELMGLKEGKQFRFKCAWSHDGMMKEVAKPEGECSAASGGVTITSERLAAGIKFTESYMEANMGIMVKTSKHSSSGWAFVKPFEWNLWLALGLTLLLFPLVILSIEYISQRRRFTRRAVGASLEEAYWRSAITMLSFDHFAVASTGGRLAVVTFCFLAFLMCTTYSALLTAHVTVSRIGSTINGVQDLEAKAVGATPIFVERLRSMYGIVAVPQQVYNGSDYVEWVNMVETGKLAAIIRSEPILQWLANNDAPDCSVTVLPQTILPFGYGIAFNQNTSDALVKEWNAALLQLREEGTLQRLKTNWILGSGSGCQTGTQVNQLATGVSFANLWGLWAILGAGVLLGYLVALLQHRAGRHNKSSTQVHPNAPAGASSLDSELGEQAAVQPFPNEHLSVQLCRDCSHGRHHNG